MGSNTGKPGLEQVEKALDKKESDDSGDYHDNTFRFNYTSC
jgi:hypothetical protein